MLPASRITSMMGLQVPNVLIPWKMRGVHCCGVSVLTSLGILLHHDFQIMYTRDEQDHENIFSLATFSEIFSTFTCMKIKKTGVGVINHYADCCGHVTSSTKHALVINLPGGLQVETQSLFPTSLVGLAHYAASSGGLGSYLWQWVWLPQTHCKIPQSASSLISCLPGSHCIGLQFSLPVSS